ncbi:hypothetical protein SMD44_07708 [Streptomyces alboflavus]|uniref:Uncharacterized protein n=1 Tax=Streptomyces alboflavus TaxID=67267 RepID=A0A1Z1WP41_9ACTN|nr:hypothetical protein [Streptomyces alboflavus]ARX88221.1 hypothetical protein SMD44_07708 [Streptomyces alboflavus]
MLPVLAVTVTLHLRGGRFPRRGELSLLAAPAVALVLMAWLMGSGGWTPAVVTCLVTASLAAAAVYAALRLGLCGSGARPWAAPLAVAAWTAVATSVVLQVLPWDFQWSPAANAWTTDDRTAGVSWPLAFLLPVPWVTALLLLTCPLLPPLIRPGWKGHLALARCSSPRCSRGGRPCASRSARPPATSSPSSRPVAGRRLHLRRAHHRVRRPDHVVRAVVVLVAHLYATGIEPRRLGPGARRDCVTLLLFAAAATVIGAPDTWLPYWTTAAALFMAWAGAHLLLPPSRAEHAKRLHRLTGAAHARVLNSLARALLFAEAGTAS